MPGPRIWRRMRHNHLTQSSRLLRIGLLLVCMHASPISCDSRRPVYNIAHMVNSIVELDEYLDRGANAVELDVAFYRNGTVRSVYHGYPCDCYRVCDERQKLHEYLNHVRNLVNPKHRSFQKQLTLLVLDLKLDEVSRALKYTAGEEIAKNLITHLWNNDKGDPPISVLVSIGHTSDSDVIRGIRDTFTKSNRGTSLQKLGFDVGLNDDLSSIRRMWSKLGVTSNRWQGDGLTNCLRPLKVDDRLRNAVRIRDSNNGYIEKVYDWTVDLTVNMRSSLRVGVDAILTNFPERVHSVLQEKEFKDSYRLATSDDNPFSKVSVSPVKTKVGQLTLDTYVGSLREVTVAFMGYLYDFYKLRLQRPSTLFPFIQEILSRMMPALREYRSTMLRLSRSGLIG